VTKYHFFERSEEVGYESVKVVAVGLLSAGAHLLSVALEAAALADYHAYKE
jgi:hypothetical protein